MKKILSMIVSIFIIVGCTQSGIEDINGKKSYSVSKKFVFGDTHNEYEDSECLECIKAPDNEPFSYNKMLFHKNNVWYVTSHAVNAIQYGNIYSVRLKGGNKVETKFNNMVKDFLRTKMIVHWIFSNEFLFNVTDVHLLSRMYYNEWMLSHPKTIILKYDND